MPLDESTHQDPNLMARAGDSISSAAASSGWVELASDPEEARLFQNQIEMLLKNSRYNECDIFSIKLSVHEALTNAIKHGNRQDRGRKVHVGYSVCPERFEIVITDEGPGFDPNRVPDCRALENLERPGGRGILLMRHYMTQVTFNACGNSVAMVKSRSDE